MLWGKEFKNLGKKQNKSLAVNAKVFFGGGKSNMTNYQARIGEYYDATKPDKVGYIRAMKTFLNLLYCVYF